MRSLTTHAIVIVVTVVVALAAPPRPARACSCIHVSDAHDMQQADLVFLARAGAERRVGPHRVQQLEVLHALKGEPGKRFTIKRRADAMISCERSFRDKEVALVFARKGAVDICAGNYDLEAVQLERMASYIKLGAVKATAPDAAALQAALAAALEGHLRGRSRVPVRYEPLAGRSFRVGQTTLRFGTRRLKHMVELRHALLSGPMLFVAGRYHREGHDFGVLLLRDKQGAYRPLARRWAKARSAPIPDLKPIGH